MNIPSKLLRAAMHCQAKSDIRYYLNGIHIKNNLVEATNGHVAVRMTMAESCEKDVIVNIASTVPAKAVNTVLVIDDEPIAKHYDKDEKLIAVSPASVIDGEYPEIDEVIPSESKPVEEIGINTSYLGLWAKMFKESPAAKLTFNGSNSAVKITSNNEILNEEYGNPLFVVMPARL